MKQLEKEGRRTAMGKTMWHYTTVGHILKNRLYCGGLEYRKEYVPDYLEQKRAKNNGELERGIAGVEQSEVLRDKEVIEEQLKKERGRYETLLDMRMNNEIPKEVFSRKQQEVGERIAELEQRMAQYGDVEPATEADMSGKLENLRRLMGQFAMPDDERSISSRISFDKSILSSSPEYMSDLRRIAWYSPSLLTIPFMTLCMRVSMSRYNAESFSDPIPPSVVLYLNSVLVGWQVGK